MINNVESSRNKEFFKLNQLKQYGRRLNLEFEGVPQCEDENVTDIVMKLTKSMTLILRLVTSQ